MAEKKEIAGGAKENVTLRLPPETVAQCEEVVRLLRATPGAVGLGPTRGEVLRRALEIGLAEMERGLSRSKPKKSARV
jgi:hypothetical protein